MNRHAIEIELDQLETRQKEIDARQAELMSKLNDAKDECYVVTYFTAFKDRKVFENFIALPQEKMHAFCENFDKNMAEHNYHRTSIYYDLHLIERVVHETDRTKWTSNSLALIGNPTYARIKFKGEDNE